MLHVLVEIMLLIWILYIWERLCAWRTEVTARIGELEGVVEDLSLSLVELEQQRKEKEGDC